MLLNDEQLANVLAGLEGMAQPDCVYPLALDGLEALERFPNERIARAATLARLVQYPRVGTNYASTDDSDDDCTHIDSGDDASLFRYPTRADKPRCNPADVFPRPLRSSNGVKEWEAIQQLAEMTPKPIAMRLKRGSGRIMQVLEIPVCNLTPVVKRKRYHRMRALRAHLKRLAKSKRRRDAIARMMVRMSLGGDNNINTALASAWRSVKKRRKRGRFNIDTTADKARRVLQAEGRAARTVIALATPKLSPVQAAALARLMALA